MNQTYIIFGCRVHEKTQKMMVVASYFSWADRNIWWSNDNVALGQAVSLFFQLGNGSGHVCLGWWFGFLGSPYERDCYLRAPLEPQTTNQNQPFTISWMATMRFSVAGRWHHPTIFVAGLQSQPQRWLVGSRPVAWSQKRQPCYVEFSFLPETNNQKPLKRGPPQKGISSSTHLIFRTKNVSFRESVWLRWWSGK